MGNENHTTGILSGFIGGCVQSVATIELLSGSTDMGTYTFKVILLGNSEVGKTTLFRKLMRKPTGDPRNSLTDSLDLGACLLEFPLTQSVKVQVWL